MHQAHPCLLIGQHENSSVLFVFASPLCEPWTCDKQAQGARERPTVAACFLPSPPPNVSPNLCSFCYGHQLFLLLTRCHCHVPTYKRPVLPKGRLRWICRCWVKAQSSTPSATPGPLVTTETPAALVPMSQLASPSAPLPTARSCRRRASSQPTLSSRALLVANAHARHRSAAMPNRTPERNVVPAILSMHDASA